MPSIAASGSLFGDAAHDLGVATLEVGRRADAHLDAAGGVLVSDVVRDDLEHHRVADLLGGLERLVDVVRGALLDHRHAVGREEALRLLLGEDDPAGLRGAAEHRLEVVARRCDVDGELRGGLVEEFEVARVAVHAQVDLDRVFRRLVGGDVRPR